jgi:mycothione reductase
VAGWLVGAAGTAACTVNVGSMVHTHGNERAVEMKHKVKEYDIVAIGSGAGANIVDAALVRDLKVAWVDKGPLGGTCSNTGCIPSKMVIFPADRIVELQEAGKLGVAAQVQSVDFAGIMERTRRVVRETQAAIREGIRQAENLDFYELEGHFVDDYTLQVGEDRIRGQKVFIAAGTRVFIPPIPGLDGVDYLTNESVFELTERPESLIVMGGGYIATEFGHFFAAMGTEVTMLEMLDRLVSQEEPEISRLLDKRLSERMDVHTNTRAIAVRKDGAGIVLTGKDLTSGQEREFAAQSLLVAVGRRSNADLLKVENSGIDVDERGFIQVDDYLETSKPGIWAFGDINGKFLFKHVANRESVIVWYNSTHEEKIEMDYGAIPHAVFSHPQIAGVGLTEAQAKEQFDILVGTAKYTDVAKGTAMMEEDGFAKAIVERKTRRILGFHIIGPFAPILIQEVVNVMASGGTTRDITRGIHVHPATPELILVALDRLREPH